MTLTKTYHCQDPDKPMGTALCGTFAPVEPLHHVYDRVEDWLQSSPTDHHWRNSHKPMVRCQACMDHPNLPLLILGELP